jgi:hypothetical protein
MEKGPKLSVIETFIIEESFYTEETVGGVIKPTQLSTLTIRLILTLTRQS